MRPWSLASARRSRTRMRPCPTQKGNPANTRPPAGSSQTVSVSIGSAFVGKEPSCCISMTHTSNGCDCSAAPTRHCIPENALGCAECRMQWITRVPATLSEAQAALAQVDPQALASLQEGYRYHELTSTDGGIEQRWVLMYSEPRQPQAQRTIDRQLRQQSDAEVKALKKLCSSTFACEADTRQALAIFEQDL